MSTAVVTLACGNCCGTSCFQLECRSRGGIARLCGHSEYPPYASSPPRYYKTKRFDGCFNRCVCYGGTCIEGTSTPANSFSSSKSAGKCTGGATVAISPGTYNSGTGQIAAVLSFSSFYGGTLPECPTTTEGYGPSATLVYFSFTPGGGAEVPVSYGAFGGGGCPGGNSAATPMIASVGNGYGTASAVVCVCVDKQATTYSYTSSGQIRYDPDISCDAPVESSQLTTRQGYSSTVCGDGAVTGPPSITYMNTVDDDTFSVLTFLQGRTATATSIQRFTTTTCSGNSEFAEIRSSCPTPSGETGPAFRREKLLSEDLEDDAIDRLMASPAGAWSNWQVVDDGTGVTCANPLCCLSTYEERTARTFEVREAQYRATVTGQGSGAMIEIKIAILRKLRNEAVYQPYLTRTYNMLADFAGEAVVEDDVPNAEGYDTYAARCSFKVL